MIAQQIRKYDMLRRVEQFMDAFAAQLTVVNTTAARQELDQLVKDMGVHESTQAISTLNAKGQTAQLAALRHDLVEEHMRPVATIAAAHLRTVPNFQAMQVPRSSVKVAVLVQDAIAMAEAARPYQQVFVANGRAADFADALVAAAGAVRASIDARAQNIGNRAGARQGLTATATRAIAVVRLLDAQIKRALVDDPTALAAWQSAKRIGRGKVVPIEATVPPQTTPPAPAPAEVKAA